MPKDFLIEENGSPMIKNGDFEIGEATLQHQRSLLRTFAGEIRQHPTVGVGLKGYLDDDNLEVLPRRVSSEFARDGMAVSQCRVTETGTLLIKAEYGS